MASLYPAYKHLSLDRPAARVLRITMARGKLNEMDFQMHRDLARIWPLVDRDDETHVIVLRGAGRAFSAGGDFDLERQLTLDPELRAGMHEDARDLVRNLIEMEKPLVAAVAGPAAGGGLVAAMLADVSIAGRSAKIVDGHTHIGVAAGDHATLVWPLLCGMAKAKYYLLTCAPLSGEEAERIGLVTMCVDDNEVEDRALAVATSLAAGAPAALRATKRSLNSWYTAMWPIFEAALEAEMRGFTTAEAAEGIAALVEKRRPRWHNA